MRFFKRKHLIAYTLFAALALALGYSQAYYVPLAKKWMIREVNRLSLQHLPVEIDVRSLEFGIFPPRLIAQKIKATPTGQLSENLAPVVVEQTEIKINWVALLLGQVKIGEFKIIKADIKWVEKKKDEVRDRPTTFDLNLIFDTLAKVPLERLVFESLSFMSSSQTLGISAKADPIHATIENHGRALFLEVDAPTILIKETGANRHLDIQVETRALVDPEGLKLSRLKLKLGESFILGSGFLKGSLGSDIRVTESDLMTRFQLDLSNLQHWLRVILPQQQLPTLDGMIRADVNWKKPLQGSQEVTLKTQSQNLSLEKFLIGSVEGEAELKEQTVLIKELSVSNSSGEVHITDGQLQLNDQMQFAGRVNAPQLELAQLLENLGIPNIPLKLDLKGALSCSGHLQKTPVVNCTGDVEAPHLHVWTPTPSKNTIVKLHGAHAQGSVHISERAVTYDAQIRLGKNSRGQSRGAIDYQKGFKIDFSGSPADLSDIEDLAGLDLKGVTHLSGHTEGDSRQARFGMSIDGKGIFLKKYFLGDATAKLQYAKSKLRIADIQGQIGRSLYSSVVELDFSKDQILVEGQTPKLDLTDLRSSVSQVISLPFDFHGSGSAEIKLWGPLEINRLNYNLKSTLLRGDIAKESFDQLFFNVTSVDGRIQADRVQALKAQSTVDIKGTISPQGEMDLKVVGSNLRLEESENLTALGFDVNGRADLDMNVKGSISDPQFDLSGKVTKVVVGDSPADDSSIQLKWNTKKIEGEGQLLGKTLIAQMTWPFVDGQPFHIQLQSDKWDFAKAFSLVSSSARQKQFDSSISGLLKLSSPDGSLKSVEGAIDVSEIFLKRGPLTMAAKEPFKVRLVSGVVRSSPILFEGSAGTLRLQADGSSVSRLKVDLTGKMDLALGVLFTPFLSDLRGQININTNIQGSLVEPAITGSAYIEDGFAKLEPFPQPFEKITADVLFSQKDVVINTLKATLGGGPVTGDGRIRILSSEQIPIDIKGQFNNVSVHFPENVRTRGSGLWQIKGSQRPYLLSLNYGIQGGEVTTEFGGDGLGEKSSTLNTAYLPKFVATSTAQPIEVDVHLNLDNTLPVRNSLLDSQVRGSLRVQGPTDRLLFTGSLNPVPGGKIFFRETPFEILSGYVEYQGDTVDMAKIYISGQAQVIEMIRDENDREVQNTYQIQLIVQGRANNPKITLSSLPPMDQKEIASLLALGMTPASLQSNRSAGQLATSNSMQLGSAILQKPLSKEVKKRLGFDVQLGQAQSTATNADTLQVTIGRQFTPNFSATASRTLEQNPRSAARAEVKVNKNISVIGSWQTREGALEDNKDVNRSIFGMDFEYKVNFK